MGLRRQTAGRDRFAVLLVDSGSTGDAPARLRRLARQHPGASLIRMEQPGLSVARNAGAAAARTPYIAYIDDDAVPAPDWVERILAALESQRRRPPSLLGGRILPRWQVPLPTGGRHDCGACCRSWSRRAGGNTARRRWRPASSPTPRTWSCMSRPCWRPAVFRRPPAGWGTPCCPTRKCSSPGGCRMPAIRSATIPASWWST